MACAPMKTPVFSRSVFMRSISVSRRAAADVGLDIGAAVVGGQHAHQRVLGRQDHEGGAEHGVRPRGEDADRLDVIGLGREVDLGALGSADPVRLHRLDRLGVVEPVEVQQLVAVVRDAEVPLLQVALVDLRVAAPAAPIRPLDLLAGQHDLVLRAPVDRAHRLVRQPGLVQLQEQPLLPAVVARVAGDDLARSSRTLAPISRIWRRIVSMFS